MKTYNLQELHKMDLVDLCFTASEHGIDFLDKKKQTIIYEILDAQKDIKINADHE